MWRKKATAKQMVIIDTAAKAALRRLCSVRKRPYKARSVKKRIKLASKRKKVL